jgi:CBS domain-containing protein
MLVSDILRHKGHTVVTIKPELEVDDFVAVLADQRIGAAVISPDGMHVTGIVSERDVILALAAHGQQVLTWRVSEICSRDLVIAQPADKLDHLMSVMTERRTRHLPVVVDGELRGIVSIGDVVKARVSELEEEQKALTGYITGR